MSENSPKTFQVYIDGDWTAGSSSKTFEQRNPARMSEVTSRFPSCTAEDTRKAIAAAEKAFPLWRDTPPLERAKYLKKAWNLMIQRREEISRVMTLENGKTLKESLMEIDAAISEMEFQIAEGVRMYGDTLPSGRPGVFAYSVRCPLGAVGIISPWNFPFNVPTRKCTPALMAGNTVVYKPASLTPQMGLKFTELFVDAGLPAGVFNLVTGSGREVGNTLVMDPRIKAISFTGSTAVGKGIQKLAAENLTRTQLELGGKNPIVVLEDADLDIAADAAVTATYACAGQWCTSTSRAVVVSSIIREFTERVVQKTKALRVGEGTTPGVDMGPVCGTEQLNTILDYIEKGKRQGAALLTGGHRLTGPEYDDGCFIAPTVFGAVRPDMTIAQEEIFGPVMSIIEVKDFEEAVQVANGVVYGLSSSIYTNDLQRALTFLERTDVGLTHVNMLTAAREPQLSFGGVKESGFGIPESGKTGIEFFTEHKVAYVKYR